MTATEPLLNTLQTNFLPVFRLLVLLLGLFQSRGPFYPSPLILFPGVPSVQGSPDGHPQCKDSPAGKAQDASHPVGKVGPCAKTQATYVRLQPASSLGQ